MIEGEEGEEELTPPDYASGGNQTVAVGSQIAEFSENVPVELRPHVSNAFLLAQLAANKLLKTDPTKNTSDWYGKYVEVLSNIGWTLEGDARTVREVAGSSLEVHKEIIPVITAALGPAAAAAATVIAVLNGLSNMNKDQPWITLFSHESQRASANQFQISYADVEDGVPVITLLGFELDAENAVTQILFFKFGAAEAKLRTFDVRMSLNESIFASVKDAIQARLVGYTLNYVGAIEI
tara:strand:- start:65940 stop:66653 length:714 start_codon:yes stop_codon:yes gene_type:complete